MQGRCIGNSVIYEHSFVLRVEIYRVKTLDRTSSRALARIIVSDTEHRLSVHFLFLSVHSFHGWRYTTKAKPKSGSGGGGGGGGGGSIAEAELGGTFQSIGSFNLYQSRWAIKARITWKGVMASWNNARGSGIFCKIELADRKVHNVSQACDAQPDRINTSGDRRPRRTLRAEAAAYAMLVRLSTRIT